MSIIMARMTGQQFIDKFAPFTIPKVRTVSWLWQNEAVWNGETLMISHSVYPCLADADTSLETFKTLDIKFIPRVQIPFSISSITYDDLQRDKRTAGRPQATDP